MDKEKTATIFCVAHQTGKLVKQLRFLVSEDVTKIIVEESGLKQQRDALLAACIETQKLLAFIAENYKSAPHFPTAERLTDAAIALCK